MRVYFDSYSKWNGMKVAINSLADLSFSRSSGAGSQYGQDRILESPYAIVLRVRYATSTSLLRNRLSSESDRRIYPKYVGDNERFRDGTRLFRKISEDRFGRFPYHTNTTKRLLKLLR